MYQRHHSVQHVIKESSDVEVRVCIYIYTHIIIILLLAPTQPVITGLGLVLWPRGFHVLRVDPVNGMRVLCSLFVHALSSHSSAKEGRKKRIQMGGGGSGFDLTET